ncbi:MAG: hypothetical protein CVU38_10110 [Chloroflexi bacterium HGW-Chloroflexi-1]|nr:MAG: hypothetical protein CVU38_10110 [Chloroflexi bacterium HGW-Chloroflexi-1]
MTSPSHLSGAGKRAALVGHLPHCPPERPIELEARLCLMCNRGPASAPIASKLSFHNDTYTRALGSEVETLRVLKHPGIVRMYPIQVDERHFSYMTRAVNLPGSPWYFVMEHLSGGTLEELLHDSGPLTPALAVEIIHQVGVALDYVHVSGYAHLDIKTNNILFRYPLNHRERPEAVLIDFGAAQKALRRAEVDAGSLMYLSPERVEVLVGKRSPETLVNKAAADVYALGVTLYRTLTGDLPFSGRRAQLTTAILTELPTHPMQVNRQLTAFPDLDNLIMQMLEKDPTRRPGMKETLTRLDQIVPPPRVDGATREAAPPDRLSAGWKTAALALGAVALIEAAAGGVYWFGLRPPPEPPPPVVTPVQINAPPGAADTPVPAAPTKTPSKSPTRPPAIATAAPTVDPTPAPDTPGPPDKEPTLVPTRTPAPTRPPAPTTTPIVNPPIPVPNP